MYFVRFFETEVSTLLIAFTSWRSGMLENTNGPLLWFKSLTKAPFPVISFPQNMQWNALLSAITVWFLSIIVGGVSRDLAKSLEDKVMFIVLFFQFYFFRSLHVKNHLQGNVRLSLFSLKVNYFALPSAFIRQNDSVSNYSLKIALN